MLAGAVAAITSARSRTAALSRSARGTAASTRRPVSVIIWLRNPARQRVQDPAARRAPSAVPPLTTVASAPCRLTFAMYW